MNTSTPLNPMHHVLGLQLVLFVFFLFLMTATNVRGGGFLQPKTHVSITNDLSPETILTIHCKSKDDDLGTHDIGPGDKYEIVFYPNFIGTTLYFCGVQTYSGPVKYFDIYRSSRENKICLKCKFYDWRLRNGRPCMLNPKTNQFDICYDWN